MRNAVIRKKVLQEQALLRKYMFTPQRLIVPASTQGEWDKALATSRLWATS